MGGEKVEATAAVRAPPQAVAPPPSRRLRLRVSRSRRRSGRRGAAACRTRCRNAVLCLTLGQQRLRVPTRFASVKLIWFGPLMVRLIVSGGCPLLYRSVRTPTNCDQVPAPTEAVNVLSGLSLI